MHSQLASTKAGEALGNVRPKRTSSIALLLAMLAACHVDSSESTDSALVGGSVESGYASVGYLYYSDGVHDPGRENLYAFCTGTLIADDVVLTAAHCIDDDQHEMVFGVGTIDQQRHHRIRAKFRHPAYQFTSKLVANDIAVLKLETPVNGATIAKLGKGKVGTTYRTIGYGQTVEDVQTFDDPGKGLRKSAEVKISKLEGTTLIGSSKSAGQCYGDSGGPLMVQGKDEIVGVLSSLEHEACTIGDDSYYMSVDGYRTFIEAAMKANDPSDLAGSPPAPDWSLSYATTPRDLRIDPRDGSIIFARSTVKDAYLSDKTVSSLTSSGKERWKYDTKIGEGFEVQGVLADGTVVVQIDRSKYVGLSAGGQFLWNRSGRHSVTSGRLFDLELQGTLAEIAPDTGTDLFRTVLDHVVPNEFNKAGRRLIDEAVSASDGTAWVVSDEDLEGDVLSTYDAKGKKVGAVRVGILGPDNYAVAAPKGVAYVEQGAPRKVAKYDAKGTKVWEIDVSYWGRNVPSPDGTRLYRIGVHSPGVDAVPFEAYDAKSGQLLYQKRWDAFELAFGKDGGVFVLRANVAEKAGWSVVALDRDGTEQWSTDAASSDEIATDREGALYFAHDKTLSKLVP